MSGTASSIQEISELVTAAVNKLAEEASKMLEFVNADVIRDYDHFVDIIVQYEKDADEMNENENAKEDVVFVPVGNLSCTICINGEWFNANVATEQISLDNHTKI